jgi:hypothetical protein
MSVDEANFKTMLARAAVLGGSVNALNGDTYSDVMTAINGRLRDRWQYPVPPASHRALVTEVAALLGNQELTTRQADRLQRAFRGT